MADAGRMSQALDAPVRLPYALSWLDRLIAWIEALPGPAWAAYLALLAAEIVLANAARWLAGVQRSGTIELFPIWLVLFNVYGLATAHYFSRLAGRALERFRPALDISDAEFALLRYRLTTSPPRATALAAIAGALLVLPLSFWAPARYIRLFASGQEGLLVVGGLFSAAALAILFTDSLRIVRQLQMVSKIHEMAAHLDLFEPEPLYAFSGLTAQIGMGMLAATYASVAVWPATVLSSPLMLVPFGIMAALALACFLLPLLSMHDRLAGEKKRMVMEANAQFRSLTARLHALVQEDNLERVDGLNKAMESIDLELDRLGRLSTWPWEPGTLRGFLSALLLPIVLWMITRVLEVWFPVR